MLPEPINYGMGVVCFPNAIDVDQDLIIPYLASLKQKAVEEDYTIVKEEDGASYAINRSGHRFSIDDIDRAASHIMNFLDENSPKELVSFFEKCEETFYTCLLRYIEIFPMILPNIWWRTLGHVLAYGPNSDMGIHNDNDVNYQPGFEPDLQLATRNVLGVIIYLNSSVPNKEDIKKHEYNNGEIVFEYANATHYPKAGDILMFPSNYLGTHEIKPCLNGSRYAYIGYFAQGSSHPEKGINIVHGNFPAGKQGQVWLENIRKDYVKYIISKYNIEDIKSVRDPKLISILRGTIRKYNSSGTEKNLPHKKEKND
jgi:hypothetical protein